MLGRPHEVRGVVEHGDHRGREFGFPTANVAVPDDILLPADGIYAGWYQRPDGDGPPARGLARSAADVLRGPALSLLEAHLLDFDDDLYGEQARVRRRAGCAARCASTRSRSSSRRSARDVAAARRALGGDGREATKGRVVMGLLFFPRGGSAQVARYLAPCLADAGWTVSLVTGSLGRRRARRPTPGTFFAGLDDVHRARLLRPPGVRPMHPSLRGPARRARPRCCARVPPVGARRDLGAHGLGRTCSCAAGRTTPTLFHLHHLTPQHEAVLGRAGRTRRWWPTSTAPS